MVAAYAPPRADPKGWQPPVAIKRHDDGSVTVDMSFWHSGDADEPQFYYRKRFVCQYRDRPRFSSPKPTMNWPHLRKIMGW